MHIVIRAGGAGSRLWPISRKAAPKQFHAFLSERTMLQEALDRVRDIVPLENVFVSTSLDCKSLVLEQCAEIPAQNLIIEPARKDTAAAIGLESMMIAKRDPDAIVASLGSDHSVRLTKEFQEALLAAEEFVKTHPEYIVPIAIQPQHADTSMGYIQYGESIEEVNGTTVHEVVRFTEKPDAATAKEFFEAGNYLWNANMFVWSVKTILDLYKTHLPEMYVQLEKIAAAIDTPEQEQVLHEVYPQLEKVAVDYAIIEKTHKIATIAANIGWNDIGDWSRLKDELSATEAENVAINAELETVDTNNVLVYRGGQKKLITTIGLDDLVIIDTDDALLIAKKSQTGRVKEIVEALEANDRTDVL